MSLPEIWRCVLPEGQSLVVVNANSIERDKLNKYTVCAIDLLQVDRCQDLCKSWPFERIVSIPELLFQLDTSLPEWPFVYMSRPYSNTELHAIGLGPNRHAYERAGRLAMVLAALLHGQAANSTYIVRELAEEVHLARQASAMQIQPCNRQHAPSTQEDFASTQVVAHQERPLAPSAEFSMPVLGSWAWWYRDFTVVLCEDLSSSLFSNAKNLFLGASGAENCNQLIEEYCEDFNKRLLECGFPDILCAGVYKYYGFKAIGIGRTIEHRFRAACVGLAAQIGRRMHWSFQPDRTFRFVIDEFFDPGSWFPCSLFRSFHDLETEQFWQNIGEWRADSRHHVSLPFQSRDLASVPAFGSKVIEDIVICCQPALLAELERRGDYAEIDISLSQRPWARIIAGHVKKDDLVGPGIQSFAFAVDREKISPYHERPIVFSRIVRVDGSVVTFSSSRRTDSDLQRDITRQDVVLAFRLAAGWEVNRRWKAFQFCVFQDIVDDFRKQFRAEGWQTADFEFLQQPGRRACFAWTLSEQLKHRFRDWLDTDRQVCDAVNRLRGSVAYNTELQETIDNAVAALSQQSPRFSAANFEQTRRPVNSQSSSCSVNPLFNPIQRHMLNDCLGLESRLLSQLDPSRDDGVEETYRHCIRWFEANDKKVRFSHDSISPYFRNGAHQNHATDATLQMLVDNPKEAESMPALVAIAYQSLFFVIFGNRRLNVYKQCAQQTCSQVWFKVIVHKFPECQAILDAELRVLFRLKAIHAMDTLTSGTTVTTRPWQRAV